VEHAVLAPVPDEAAVELDPELEALLLAAVPPWPTATDVSALLLQAPAAPVPRAMATRSQALRDTPTSKRP
jgi:hypothetical protein